MPFRRFLLLLGLFLSCTSQTPDQQTVVAIQPLGNYNASLAKEIQQAITRYYGVKVQIQKQKPIPESHFVTIKSPRYRADSIIHYLKETKPAGIDYVIGFTDLDISTTKTDSRGNVMKPVEKYTDWGVMGLAYLGGPTGVVSTFRLKSKPALLKERTVKVALHELGHEFGLPHCPDKKCFMTDAVESIQTIDNARLDLCATCKRKIGLPR